MSVNTGDCGHGDGEVRNLGDIMDCLKRLDEAGEVSVNGVLGAFQDRSTGVLVSLIGLVAALPVIGAIPGVSITSALLLLAVIARSAAGGGSLALPGSLGRARIGKERFEEGIDKGRRVTDVIDRLLRPRLTILTDHWSARAVIKAAVALLAVSMIPLAFVPWGVTAPACGIVAFGLALLARDGAFALAGYALIGVTALVALWLT